MAWTLKLSLLLAPIFLCLIAEPRLTFVSGDAAVINDVCGKTTRPDYCHRCYDLYKRSAQEDAKALGRTSIDCSYNQFGILRTTIGDYVANATDKDFKSACVDCAFKLQSVEQHITNALLGWQNAHYADAGNQMLAAQQETRACGDELQKFKPSQGLVDEVNAVQGFCEASDGVLKQLH